MSSINKPQPQNSSAMKLELAYMEEICPIKLSLMFDLVNANKKILDLYQNAQNQIQQLQEQVSNLEITIQTKDEKIQELECLPHPESANGDAICNWLS